MVGNDVVDLRAAAEPRHPGFDARVFDASELARVEADASLRWSFWAAKEAAYKRARRDDPGVVFSPGRFAVELGPSGRGSVRHGSRAWSVRVEVGSGFVHAVAADTPEDVERALARVAPLEDPAAESREVRGMALGDLARVLQRDAASLHIERRGRLPCLRIDGCEGATPISLSHHGRFVAYAWLPTRGASKCAKDGAPR